MSERVDIWKVIVKDGAPVLIRGSALVSPKRVKLDPYDARFGQRIEYATKGNSEPFGRGGRTEAAEHWFSKEAALRQWGEYSQSMIEMNKEGLASWEALAKLDVVDE